MKLGSKGFVVCTCTFVTSHYRVGGDVLLDEEYKDMVGETQEGFDLTVQCDLDNLVDTPG